MDRMRKNRPLIEFKDITVIKGDKAILNGITVSVLEGEHAAILGPNGSGKSSFIKTITREFYPIERDGRIFRIFGEDNWDVFTLRKSLGIVSNELQSSFSRTITGMEVVLSGFFSSIGVYRQPIRRKMRNKAESIIDFLEVGHLKGRNMNEMSSGEARRFLIGRALVHDPKALILDEPANSLDISATHKFRQIIRKISRSGIGIIVVTHNFADVIPEISRVILMKDGSFYKDGRKDSIITSLNMTELFSVPVMIRREKGYYYAIAE